MVNHFSLLKTPRLFSGLGEIKRLPELSVVQDRPVLLVTGKNTLHRDEVLQRLIQQWSAKTSIQTFIIDHEPSPADIDGMVNEAHKKNDAVVVAIGGGSVVDAGKALSAMLPLGEPIINYLEVVGTQSHPGIKAPFIAIPTTSGTGSEASSNAVISQTGPNGFKRSLRHDNLVPDVVILDPQLTFTCPPKVTAFSGMDAITQMIEAYVSTKSNTFIRSLIEGAVADMDQMLVRAIANGSDAEARARMQYAAYISGVALANCGLGMVHGFASELGGFFDIPHGLVCARLAAVSHGFNISKAIDQRDEATVERYARLYQAMTQKMCANPQEAALKFAELLRRLSSNLDLPGFSEYGIEESHLEAIARQSGIKNNPVDVLIDEKIEMLRSCL